MMHAVVPQCVRCSMLCSTNEQQHGNTTHQQNAVVVSVHDAVDVDAVGVDHDIVLSSGRLDGAEACCASGGETAGDDPGANELLAGVLVVVVLAIYGKGWSLHWGLLSEGGMEGTDWEGGNPNLIGVEHWIFRLSGSGIWEIGHRFRFGLGRIGKTTGYLYSTGSFYHRPAQRTDDRTAGESWHNRRHIRN